MGMSARCTVLVCICVVLFSFLSQGQVCNGVCEPHYAACQQSTCDASIGFCVNSVKVPTPPGCCERNQDCETDSCTLGSCNFERNQCQYTNICTEPPEQSSSGIVCSKDRDCDDGDSCSAEKCMGGFCVTSRNPDVRDSTCCSHASDCPELDCQEAFCSESFRCYYLLDVECELQHEEEEHEEHDHEDEHDDHEDEDEHDDHEDEDEHDHEDEHGGHAHEVGTGDALPGAIIGLIILAGITACFIVFLVFFVIFSLLSGK